MSSTYLISLGWSQLSSTSVLLARDIVLALCFLSLGSNPAAFSRRSTNLLENTINHEPDFGVIDVLANFSWSYTENFEFYVVTSLIVPTLFLHMRASAVSSPSHCIDILSAVNLPGGSVLELYDTREKGGDLLYQPTIFAFNRDTIIHFGGIVSLLIVTQLSPDANRVRAILSRYTFVAVHFRLDLTFLFPASSRGELSIYRRQVWSIY